VYWSPKNRAIREFLDSALEFEGDDVTFRRRRGVVSRGHRHHRDQLVAATFMAANPALDGEGRPDRSPGGADHPNGPGRRSGGWVNYP
jgi:hypothetical protein